MICRIIMREKAYWPGGMVVIDRYKVVYNSFKIVERHGSIT